MKRVKKPYFINEYIRKMLITIGKTYLFNFEERIRKEKVE